MRRVWVPWAQYRSRAAVVMLDPVMSSVAAAIAGKAAEAAWEGGKTACATLIRVVRERFSCDEQAAAVLQAADDNPGDEAALAGFALELGRLAAADAGFAAQVREVWPQVAVELSAGDNGVVNSSAGSVGGHLVQARDLRIEGGLHLGDVQRPDGR
jgi:hypothetical protein